MVTNGKINGATP